jgi:hypothetical protein
MAGLDELCFAREAAPVRGAKFIYCVAILLLLHAQFFGECSVYTPHTPAGAARLVLQLHLREVCASKRYAVPNVWVAVAGNGGRGGCASGAGDASCAGARSSCMRVVVVRVVRSDCVRLLVGRAGVVLVVVVVAAEAAAGTRSSARRMP